MAPGTPGEWEVAVKGLLERYPEADILQELYQSKPKFHSAQGGISQGMAVEWIKLNNLLGGEDQFRRLAGSKWDSFHATQAGINHRKLYLQDSFKKIKERGKQLAERDQQQDSQEAQAFEPFFEQFKAKAGDVYRNMVWRSVGYLKRLDSVAKVPLRQVGLEIQKDQGSHPAFYLVNMGMEREGRSGPCVAIQADSAPRLLDANTCEFQFYSRSTFYDFLLNYWKLYGRYGYPDTSRTEVLRLTDDNGTASRSAEEQMDSWLEKAWPGTR